MTSLTRNIHRDAESLPSRLDILKRGNKSRIERVADFRGRVPRETAFHTATSFEGGSCEEDCEWVDAGGVQRRRVRQTRDDAIHVRTGKYAEIMVAFVVGQSEANENVSNRVNKCIP